MRSRLSSLVPAIARRPHARGWVLVAAIYTAVTIVMATPFVDWRTLDSATFAGDGRLVVWTIAWVSHALFNGLPLFDANMFFPAREPLAYTEHMFALGLLASPVQALTHNPIAAFTALWLLSFWTNAMAAHLLAFRLSGRHDASLVAGLTFGWSYFRVLHLAHLQLQWTAWMPLGLVLLERWYRSPSFARVLLAALVGLMQILTSWYLAVISVVLYTLWLGWLAVWQRRKPMLPRLLQLAVAAGAGALVVAPFIAPYLRVLRPGPVIELKGGSADLASYIVPPQDTIIGAALETYTGLTGRWVWGEQTLFLGWLAIALAIAGCGALCWPSDSDRRSSLRIEAAFFIALAAAGFALSLGPLGFTAAPFDLLMHLTGLALFRAPARFALLVLLAVAILAALGAARVCRFMERRWSPAAAWAATGLLAVAMLAEWYPVGPNIPRAEVKKVPAIYDVLARLPPGAVMSIPDYRLRPEWFLRADYLLYASFHWQPIVNGYGRSEPPEYLSIVEQLSTFPSAASAELGRALGVRYFVVHAELLDGPALEPPATAPFRLVARAGSDYLYELTSDERWPNEPSEF